MKYSEVKLRRKIVHHLKECGLAPGNLGYDYIQEAIKLAIEDRSVLNAITKKLYPQIAKKYDTTVARVERAVRHSIELAFCFDNRIAAEVLHKYFGNTISSSTHKVPNGVFLSTLTEEIRLELMEEEDQDESR